MDWFWIALISPALWALTNILDDNLVRSIYKNPFYGTISSGILGMIPFLSIFFIEMPLPETKFILASIIAGFLIITSYYFYFKSLSIELPSITVALWNISPAIVPFLAYFALGEVLTKNQYFGFVLILVCSMYLSAINIKKFHFSKALPLMIIASLCIAISSILHKYVYATIPFWDGFIFVSLGMGLAGFFYGFCFKKGRNFIQDFMKNKRWLWIFTLVEGLNILAVFVSNLAVSKGPVSLVKVVESIQPIYVLLFALLFFRASPKHFREALAGKKIQKIALMCIMIIGLYLLRTNP